MSEQEQRPSRVLVVYPAVMLQFWIMEWASRRR